MSNVYEFYNPFVKKENSDKNIVSRQTTSETNNKSQNILSNYNYDYKVNSQNYYNMQNYDFKPRFSPHHDGHCDFGCDKCCKPPQKPKEDCKKDDCDCKQNCPPNNCFPVTPCFPCFSCFPCQPNDCCNNTPNFTKDFRCGMIFFNCQIPPYNCFDQQKQFMFFVNNTDNKQ